MSILFGLHKTYEYDLTVMQNKTYNTKALMDLQNSNALLLRVTKIHTHI